MSKGADYERELCRSLSLWFSKGVTDDYFWRSSQSGGRATTRSQKGKSTFGAHGDIAAVHPEGRKLLDKVTFELKCGYNGATSTITHLLDKPAHAAQQMFEAFIEQAHEAAQEANTDWILITKRDKRKSFIYFPDTLFKMLRAAGSQLYATTPVIRMKVAVRFKGKGMIAGIVPLDIWGTTLTNFFEMVEPRHFEW